MFNSYLSQTHSDESASAQPEVSALAHIENMSAVVYSQLVEAGEQSLLDLKWLERYMRVTQDRVEYLYNTVLMVVGMLQGVRKQAALLEKAKGLI